MALAFATMHAVTSAGVVRAANVRWHHDAPAASAQNSSGPLEAAPPKPAQSQPRGAAAAQPHKLIKAEAKPTGAAPKPVEAAPNPGEAAPPEPTPHLTKNATSPLPDDAADAPARNVVGASDAVADAATTVAAVGPAPNWVCTARPAHDSLAALTAATANSSALHASVGAYFSTLVLPRVAAGCSLISLAQFLGLVAAEPVEIQKPPVTDDGGYKSMRSPGPLRIAKLLVASDKATLQTSLSHMGLHLATHWAYAAKYVYNMLVYTHLAPEPEGASPGFLRLFVKAAGVMRVLFVLQYDFVLLTGALWCVLALCVSARVQHLHRQAGLPWHSVACACRKSTTCSGRTIK